MSRWENAPNLRTLIRLTGAMVDLWYTSPRRAPKAITLDIDDIADTVPSHQQLSLFNAPSVPMKLRHRHPGSLDLRARKDDLAHADAPDTDRCRGRRWHERRP